MSLYRDPKGERIFKKKSTESTPHVTSQQETISKNHAVNETQITTDEPNVGMTINACEAQLTLHIDEPTDNVGNNATEQ